MEKISKNFLDSLNRPPLESIYTGKVYRLNSMLSKPHSGIYAIDLKTHRPVESEVHQDFYDTHCVVEDPKNHYLAYYAPKVVSIQNLNHNILHQFDTEALAKDYIKSHSGYVVIRDTSNKKGTYIVGKASDDEYYFELNYPIYFGSYDECLAFIKAKKLK